MKTIQALIFLFLLCLAPSHAFAQPGDPDMKHHLRYFHEIQDSILKYPNNLFYKWVRADLLFSPYFQIQTKPTIELKEYLDHSSQYELYTLDSVVKTARPHYMSSELIVSKTYNPVSVLGDFLLGNQNVIIADLTELIEADAKFKNRFMGTIGQYVGIANKSYFLYKRGQLHYLSGSPEKGLNDYMTALDYEPLQDLKKRIYTSIAAYYYNIGNTGQK